jgi:hypothetical protein
MIDDDQPTFYNLDGNRSGGNVRRSQSYSNSNSNVNILPVGDKEETETVEQLLPRCEVCNSKRVEYDKIAECIICSNCGDIREASLESLIAEQRELSSQTNPYTPVKPSMISFSPSSSLNYEDIHKQDNELYKGSAQDALRLEYEKFKRRKNEQSWF